MEVENGEVPRTFHTRVDPSGRILLPAELRSRNQIEAGDPMVVIERSDGFEIRTLAQSVQEAQEYFRSVIPDSVSLVDELIADRIEEAARE